MINFPNMLIRGYFIKIYRFLWIGIFNNLFLKYDRHRYTLMSYYKYCQGSALFVTAQF